MDKPAALSTRESAALPSPGLHGSLACSLALHTPHEVHEWAATCTDEFMLRA